MKNQIIIYQKHYKEIYKNKSNEIENLKQIGKEKKKDINVLNKDNIIDNKKPFFNNSEEKKRIN